MNLFAIHLKHNTEVTLTPEDFAQPFVTRHLAGGAAIRMYATLRVCGHDQLQSFICAFENVVVGRVEALARAAEHFETTYVFRDEFEEVEAMFGPARIRAELEARMGEASGFTRDAAMGVRVALASYVPRARPGVAERDSADWSALLARQRDAAKTERDEHARVGNGTSKTASQYHNDTRHFLHGRRTEGQTDNIAYYDPNAQRHVFE